MDDNKRNTLLNKLYQMIDHCKAIRTLLDNDKNHFSNNAVDSINESNQEKARLLDQLASAMHEINNNAEFKGVNFFETIEIESKRFDSATKNAIKTMVNDLKNEITNSYQHLAINSKIVYTNIQHIQCLWDGLLSQKSQSECVYDHKGNTRP